MQLSRCEEDLYQQQVKRQQQQQSAGLPNRMSLLEKAIAVVQKEGIKKKEILSFRRLSTKASIFRRCENTWSNASSVAGFFHQSFSGVENGLIFY